MSKERKKLVKQLDKVFGDYIKERDNYRCICCGVDNRTHVIQVGHLFSRVSYSCRWSELNSHAQCSGCNLRHEYDFEVYRRAWLTKHSIREYNILYAEWSKPTKFSDADLRYMIDVYKSKLKKLKIDKEVL